MRALDTSKNFKYWAAEFPDWDSFHLQHVFAKNAFEPRKGILVRSYAEAAESPSPDRLSLNILC
jgi:hypothetical protein